MRTKNEYFLMIGVNAASVFFAMEGVVDVGGIPVRAQVDTGAVTSSMNARNILIAEEGNGSFPLRVNFTMISRRGKDEEYHEFSDLPGRYYKRHEVMIKIPAVLHDMMSTPYPIMLYVKLRSRSVVRHDISIGLDVFSQLQTQYHIRPLLQITDSSGDITPKTYRL